MKGVLFVPHPVFFSNIRRQLKDPDVSVPGCFVLRVLSPKDGDRDNKKNLPSEVGQDVLQT